MAQTKTPSSSPSEEQDDQHVEQDEDDDEEEEEEEEEVSTEDEEDTHPKTKPKPQPSPDKSGTKRTAPDNPKPVKKKPSTNASSSASAAEKKSGTPTKLFQRFWSEDDELAILKGMAEFISKKGQDPYLNCDSFHSFVKDSLHVDASTHQLKEKIGRLKKRFENNARKGKISNPHEQRVFELSNKVWGRENNGPVENTKPKPKLKPEILMQREQEVLVLDESKKHVSGDVDLLFREMCRSEELNEDELKRRLGLIEESKRKELAEKWKDVRHAEIDLLSKRSQLIAEQVRLIVEALKSSHN